VNIIQIKHAVEDDYKISNADDKVLAMGLVNAECDLDSCEDGMSYIREDDSQLQLVAKDHICAKSTRHWNDLRGCLSCRL